MMYIYIHTIMYLSYMLILRIIQLVSFYFFIVFVRFNLICYILGCFCLTLTMILYILYFVYHMLYHIYIYLFIHHILQHMIYPIIYIRFYIVCLCNIIFLHISYLFIYTQMSCIYSIYLYLLFIHIYPIHVYHTYIPRCFSCKEYLPTFGSLKGGKCWRVHLYAYNDWGEDNRP